MSEPNGYLHPNGVFDGEMPTDRAFPIAVYFHPPKQMKPMTEEEIEEVSDRREFDKLQGGMREAFYFGVRFAERHHGIGETNEQ